MEVGETIDLSQFSIPELQDMVVTLAENIRLAIEMQDKIYEEIMVKRERDSDFGSQAR